MLGYLTKGRSKASTKFGQTSAPARRADGGVTQPIRRLGDAPSHAGKGVQFMQAAHDVADSRN